MKKQWHIWALLLMALLIVVPPMIWLSVKAIEVDRAREQDRVETELARRQAELQERVSSALYRLDLKLLPLVAQEATRPYYFYDAFYESNAIASRPISSPAQSFNDLNSDPFSTQTQATNASPFSNRGLQVTNPPRSPLATLPENVLLPQRGNEQQVEVQQADAQQAEAQVAQAQIPPPLPLVDSANRQAVAANDRTSPSQAQTSINSNPAQQRTQRSQAESPAQRMLPTQRASVQARLGNQVPSPLMFQRPEFVLMHFQIDANGNITSPQQPQGQERELAISCCGYTPRNDTPNSYFNQAKKQFRFDEVEMYCADLPEAPENQKVLGTNAPSKPELIYGVPMSGRIAQNFNRVFEGKSKTPIGNKIVKQIERNTKRVNDEYNQRQETTQAFADNQWMVNNSVDGLRNLGNQTWSNTSSMSEVRWGTMQPMWINDQLILARRIKEGNDVRIQACWLDWPAIESALSEEIKDLLPEVVFEPIDSEDELNVGTAMTTIPVQLIVESSETLSTLAIGGGKFGRLKGYSGLTVSLLVAWIALALAIGAAVFLLNAVITTSERRAAFVSAVTHELRTPLTTFRMYAEMLAEKMVPPEKTQDYANTLRVQADRLSHLVENVLQFARLERGNQSDAIEAITIQELFDRFADRLTERAEEEGMRLNIDLGSIADQTIQTQPAQIEQVLFNLVDNACKYAKPSSNGQIDLTAVFKHGKLELRVRDFGPGVAEKYRKSMFQPFSKSDQDAANTAPGVGLGLALCRRMATSLGGRLYLEDCPQGASFVLEVKT